MRIRGGRNLALVHVLVLVACVGVASCSGDDDPTVAGDGTTTVAGQPDGGTVPAGGGTTTPGAPDAGGDGDGGGDGGGGTTVPGQPGDEEGTGGSSGTTAPGGGGGGDGDGVDGALDDTGPPGSFAAELLGARTGSRLFIEVLAQDGASARPATVDHLVEVAGQASGKSATVVEGTVPGDGRVWTADDVREAADEQQLVDQGSGVVSVRLLLLHGSFEDGDGTLGVAVEGAVAALFVDRIAETGTLGVGAGRLEQAVATHELGHLFGLVDLLLDTGRDDPEHPGHSTSQSSVMYWAVESDLVTQVLVGGPPVDFDDADRADLDRIRRMGS